MPQEIYKIIENRATSKFKHVTCEDEEGELQDLLESNLDLIPGGQIHNDIEYGEDQGVEASS